MSALSGSDVTAQICSTDANLAIPDGSGSATSGGDASITITIPAGFTSTIDDLNVDLRINHTYVGDLIVTLRSSDQDPGPGTSFTTVTLLNRPGIPAVNATFGCFRNNIDATADDNSTGDLDDECPATNPTIAGTHQPTGSLTDFDGLIPAGDWLLTVTDNAGADLGTIISASNCIDVSTVPVVLSSFKSKMRGNRLVTRWQTASEAFNLGFNIWGKLDGEWVQLNRRMIASAEVDSVEPLNYKRRFNVTRLSAAPTEIGISSIDSSGFEEFYGPFAIGEQYGELTVPKAIDWSAQRDKHQQAMQDAGFTFKNGRWRKTTKRQQRRAERLKNKFSDAWLKISQSGVHRVTYEELLAHDIQLNGLPIKHLAVTQSGQAIARRVTGSTERPKRFGPGGEIVFFAQTPSGHDARYADVNHVRVSADASKALDARYLPMDTEDVSTADASSSHYTTQRFGEKTGYSFIVPGLDPWYDYIIQSYWRTDSKQIEFEVDNNANLEAPVYIDANLMGGTSFDNVDADGDGVVEPDHHFLVYLNRDQYPNPIYEGFAEKVDAVAIRASSTGQLKLGTNTLEIEAVPDNGHNIDAAYFLDAQVRYQVVNETLGAHTQIDLNEQDRLVSVGNTDAIERVFAYDKHNNFTELGFTQTNDRLLFNAPPSIGDYLQRSAWLASSTGYLTPSEIYPAPAPVDLSLLDIDYVILADPSLINEDLARYVAMQEAKGRRTKVVSTHDVFNRYSDGVALPSAIAGYLRDQAQGGLAQPASPYQYVLLVGGHTYNYLGYNTTPEERPINLIPSFYRNGAESINRQIPTAVPFVDFDGDGKPERAIGRWPVRDQEQLKYVVDKNIAWHQDGSHKDSKSALFVAQKDEERNNFSASSERIKSIISSGANPWQQVESLHVSEIFADESIPSGEKISTARQYLVDSINQGAALTVYNGHASPVSWGRENLLTTSVVDQFTNTDKPSLILPLACYTTYYETPKIKSLSERLFTDNPAGAVGLSGPALLSYNSDNERFAKRVLELMTEGGKDLGTAVLEAKRAIHGSGARRQTVIYNWVTLADPTLSFNLPAVVVPVDDDSIEKQGP